jgi:hypothetical protein
MPSFRDHFAFAAGSYASHRPRYPDALFAWLASITPNRQRAWDCATDSGQAASSLAAHFEHIVATDPSLAQLDAADRTGDVHDAAMTAEAPALSSQSVDLITVAQALHWFDRPAFFAEVDRDPIPAFLRALEVAWRPPEIRPIRWPIRWPLIVRAGCKTL